MTSLSYPDLLTDGVVRLRPWREADVGCVEQASRDSRIPEGTTVPAHYTHQEGLAFIHRQHGRLTSGQGVSLAVAEVGTDRAVGLVILTIRPQSEVAGIGYWIIPSVRGRGIASRAVALMTEWGLGAAGFVRVEGWVEPGNHPSQRVLEANGYVLEGRLRSFLALGARRADALVYSRIAIVE